MAVREAYHILEGRYRLIEPLTQGGMGVIWRGRDLLLGRDVAVKELWMPPALSPAERDLLCERTMREASIAARLSHPNVVVIYDVVEEEGRPWIVMELIPSRSLAQIVADSGPLPPERVAAIGLAVLAGLVTAHASGVLHRDVKPSNVLLADDGRVVLTDFGIATAEDDPSLTQTGVIVGSPAYIAPERVRGEPAGPASDLWSLGATLYAAVEGRHAYDRAGSMATMTAVATEEPDEPERAGPLLPVLTRLLDKDPGNRLGPSDAARLLQGVANGDPVTPTAPTPMPLVDERVSRTFSGISAGRKRLIVVAAVIVPVLAAGAALLATRSGAPSATPESTRSATADSDSLPSGFRMHRDPTGFAIAIPRGWQRTVNRQGHIYFREPDGARFLLIDQRSDPQPDPAADWRRQDAARGPATRDYQLIGIRPVPEYFRAAADWEFTHRSTDGTPTHVINRGFVVSDARAYAIYWSTPEADWERSRAYFQTFVWSFQPASSTVATSPPKAPTPKHAPPSPPSDTPPPTASPEPTSEDRGKEGRGPGHRGEDNSGKKGNPNDG